MRHVADCQALHRRDINIPHRIVGRFVRVSCNCIGPHGTSSASLAHVETHRRSDAGDEEYACVVSASSVGFKEIAHAVYSNSYESNGEVIFGCGKRRVAIFPVLEVEYDKVAT